MLNIDIRDILFHVYTKYTALFKGLKLCCVICKRQPLHHTTLLLSRDKFG